MQRHLPEQIIIGEKIVDANRLEAFERCFGGAEIVLALDAEQCLLQSFDQFGRSCALDHGISIVADPLGVGLNLAIIKHFDLPLSPFEASRFYVPRSIARHFDVGEQV